MLEAVRSESSPVAAPSSFGLFLAFPAISTHFHIDTYLGNVSSVSDSPWQLSPPHPVTMHESYKALVDSSLNDDVLYLKVSSL